MIGFLRGILRMSPQGPRVEMALSWVTRMASGSGIHEAKTSKPPSCLQGARNKPSLVLADSLLG